MSHIEKYLLQIVLLLFVCCITALPGAGQVKVTASADKSTLLESELVELQFFVENTTTVQQFVPPFFKGCKVVEGPVQTSGMFTGHGPANHYVSFKYVIQPQAPGNYALSGGYATIKSRRFSFNTIRFQVSTATKDKPLYGFSEHSANDLSHQELYSDYVIRDGEDIQNKIRRNLFIRVDVSKNHCYEGEPVLATYKLYSRLCSESKVSGRPSFMGFSVFDVVDPANTVPTVEYWNDKLFNVYMIRKVQLFPLHPGTLQLDPAVVDNTITFLPAEDARNENGTPPPQLLPSPVSGNTDFGDVVTEHVRISSKPLPIAVTPLPVDTRPAIFDGAVGDFSIETSIDKREVALNDDAVIKVMIKGEGNFNIINAPRVHWPEALEVYQPEITVNVLRSEVPMRGYKTFAFTVMPKRATVIVIPPVEFSFFDPGSGHYRTIQSETVEINAVDAKEPAAPGAVTLVNPPEQIKAENRSWWMISIVLVLGLAGYLLYRLPRLRNSNNPEVKGSRKEWTQQEQVQSVKPEAGFTSKPLYRAKLMLVQQNGQGFYSELERVLWSQIREKLQLSPGFRDHKEIVQCMKDKGTDDIVISQFQLLIQQCELALYTPAFNEAEMQSVFELAEDMLDSISTV